MCCFAYIKVRRHFCFQLWVKLKFRCYGRSCLFLVYVEDITLDIGLKSCNILSNISYLKLQHWPHTVMPTLTSLRERLLLPLLSLLFFAFFFFFTFGASFSEISSSSSSANHTRHLMVLDKQQSRVVLYLGRVIKLQKIELHIQPLKKKSQFVKLSAGKQLPVIEQLFQRYSYLKKKKKVSILYF